MKGQFIECAQCKSRKSSLFHFCSIGEMDEFDRNKTCTVYKKGQTIFHEGHSSVGIFCVNEGKIKLHKMGSDGKEQIVRLIKPGDILGYRALMSDSDYSASASVIEDAKVCFIPKQTFFDVLKSNENLSDGLMKLLCRNLQESEQRMTEMAYKPVRERLAEALLLLKRTYGEADSKEKFSFRMSREDLASLVGTVKETVIRLLSDFKDEGLISTEGRTIIVNEPEKLLKISNLYD